MGKRETETEVYDPLQLFLKKPGAGGKIPIDASAFRRQLLATIVMGTLYSGEFILHYFLLGHSL